jgi:hypothetical protein
MIHARRDYQRLNLDPALADPSLLSPGSTPIAEDEPVMLFRAQDKHFLTVLSEYAALITRDPYIPQRQASAMTATIHEHIARATAWQQKHGCKSPDL